MANWDNVIVAKSDLSDLASGSGRDFGDKLVSEYFAKVLVLCTTKTMVSLGRERQMQSKYLLLRLHLQP